MENKITAIVKQLTIIFITLILGLVSFFAIVYFLFYSKGGLVEFNAETNYIISTSGLLLSIGLIPLSYFIFNQKAKSSREAKTDQQKLEIFRTASILRLSLIELIGFINIILFMFTGSDQNVIILVIVLLVFFLSKPSEYQYYNEFE